MELVAAKYKQTEIGLKPSDWEVKRLGELVDIRKGQLITDTTRINGNVPVIAGGKAPAYYHNKANRLGKTITISGSGASAGYVSFHDNPIFASDCSTIAESKEYSIEFVYYLLQLMQDKIYRMQTGGAQPHIHPSDLNPILISVPKPEEQISIATAISDADALISSLEKLIAKKRNIKQGAMSKLLQPKEGWEVKKLGNLTKVFTKQTGFDYTAYIKPSLVQFRTDDTIPFIQNKDFNNRWINFDTDYFIPKNIAIQFPKILLNEKSLLISISGSVGNIGLFDSEELAFIGGAVAILKFKDSDLIDWVMFYLKSVDGQKKLLDNVKAGSHQNLILDDIRKIEIVFPTKEEQKKIDTILSDMDGEINALETKLEKYSKVKLGMMQNLLTGKIRLL